MKRRWWMVRAESDAFEEPVVHGEPGGGRVLVVTKRDRRGNPTEHTWTAPATAAHWDESFWRDTP